MPTDPKQPQAQSAELPQWHEGAPGPPLSRDELLARAFKAPGSVQRAAFVCLRALADAKGGDKLCCIHHLNLLGMVSMLDAEIRAGNQLVGAAVVLRGKDGRDRVVTAGDIDVGTFEGQEGWECAGEA